MKTYQTVDFDVHTKYGFVHHNYFEVMLVVTKEEMLAIVLGGLRTEVPFMICGDRVLFHQQDGTWVRWEIRINTRGTPGDYDEVRRGRGGVFTSNYYKPR